MSRKAVRVGVAPPEIWEVNRALFSDLESLLPFSTEPWFRDRDRPETVVWFGADPEWLESTITPGLPMFVRVGELGASFEPATLVFTTSPRLDRRLRGLRLDLSGLRIGAIPPQSGDVVLAAVGRHPVWVQRTVRGEIVDLVAIEPGDVNGHRAMPWHQDTDTVATMVPLIHFLRRAMGVGTLDSPRVRACFQIDDPNLRWPTYGYLRFGELAADAAEHGYHVSISMVPLDGRFPNAKNVRLFKEHRQHLSLSFQGNNHTYQEFGSPSTKHQVRSIAQALRRIERFESATGLEVDRVAVPPHGKLGLEGLQAAANLGLEGMAVSPWGIPDSQRWSDGTCGVCPTLLGPNAITLLARRHLVSEEPWFALHAFLDQPLIIYLHHGDLADGLGVLRETAARVDELGAVEWCSVGAMVRSSYAMETDGDLATIRMYAPHVRIELPDDISWLVVEHPSAEANAMVRVSGSRGDVDGELGSRLPTPAGETVEVTVQRVLVDPHSVAAPRWQPWPIVRRRATETRDRLRPLLRI